MPFYLYIEVRVARIAQGLLIPLLLEAFIMMPRRPKNLDSARRNWVEIVRRRFFFDFASIRSRYTS